MKKSLLWEPAPHPGDHMLKEMVGERRWGAMGGESKSTSHVALTWCAVVGQIEHGPFVFQGQRAAEERPSVEMRRRQNLKTIDDSGTHTG